MTASVPAAQPSATLDRLDTFVREHTFGISVAAVLVLALVAASAFLIHYETNDDVTMQLVASGLVVADRPDEHLMFSNVFIGLLLKALYSSAPGVAWYGFYEFATVVAAGIACTYALLRVNPSIRQAAVTGVLLIVVVLPCLIDLQFTKTAFLASFSGLLLLMAPLRGAQPWPRLADVAGCILLVWGSLVRFESLVLAILVLAPVAVAVARAAPSAAARRAVPLALAVVVAAGLYVFNRQYYARSEGWQDFYAYNALRAEFTDYNRYPYAAPTRRAYREADWGEADYWMLQNWFYADKDRYSLKRLQQIAAAAPPASGNPFWATIYGMAVNLNRFPILIRTMLAMLVVAAFTGSGPGRVIMPIVMYGTGLALTCILGAYFWLPIRVVSALFGGTVIAAAFRPRGGDGFKRTSLEWGIDTPICVVAGLLGGILVILTIVDCAAKAARERRLHNDLQEVMRALRPRPDKLFVLWREWFPLENVVYPFESTAALRDFRCLSLSTLLQTPFTDRRLDDYRIRDVYMAICERPDVYVIAMDKLIILYASYMKQHYNTLVDARVVFPANGKDPYSDPGDSPPPFFVYQLRKRPPDAPVPAAEQGSRPPDDGRATPLPHTDGK
jgi:hypothetical protein